MHAAFARLFVRLFAYRAGRPGSPRPCARRRTTNRTLLLPWCSMMACCFGGRRSVCGGGVRGEPKACSGHGTPSNGTAPSDKCALTCCAAASPIPPRGPMGAPPSARSGTIMMMRPACRPHGPPPPSQAVCCVGGGYVDVCVNQTADGTAPFRHAHPSKQHGEH